MGGGAWGVREKAAQRLINTPLKKREGSDGDGERGGRNGEVGLKGNEGGRKVGEQGISQDRRHTFSRISPGVKGAQRNARKRASGSGEKGEEWLRAPDDQRVG